MEHSKESLELFKELVWEFYRNEKRDLPWRNTLPDGTLDPYAVLVSELMLQQTQVSRVIPKYELFLRAFPTIQDLSVASLGEVLTLWSGLGYNRRAKYLWESARVITEQFNGKLPTTIKELTTLQGVGHNTAAAVLAYAHNLPVVFIETNIRTVYIHHFFSEQTMVSDKELLPVIEATLSQENSRHWYWALMDYGSFLKKDIGNSSNRSKHYKKQTKFEGSLRQIRGIVLQLLIQGPQTEKSLQMSIPDERLQKVLRDLTNEKLIQKQGQQISLL